MNLRPAPWLLWGTLAVALLCALLLGSEGL